MIGEREVLDNLSKVVEATLRKAIIRMGEAMEIVIRGYRGRMYHLIYSRPPSPRYVRTYQLYHEVEKVVSLEGSKIKGITYNLMPYAVYVELGTYKMRPRPALSLAVESTLRDVQEKLSDTLDSTGISPKISWG